MTHYDHGPLRTYEIVWRSGHVETVQGHQVSFSGAIDLFGNKPERPHRFSIHGDFPREDGSTVWRLVLHGLGDDVMAIRDVTDAERPVGGAT